ncbi:MAG: transporter related protein [Deltaproteobacteria bacterium]|nr:transporter related protein [Deltaproteobacteria bacterium]
MIRATNLTKLYGGKRALGPVSFEIKDGETVGFLGLNGAGKTTALRLLACDLRPSSGTIEVGGVDAIAEPHEVRKRIGFLPENPPLYLDMNIVDYLTFAGELRKMTRAELKRRLPEVLELTDLTEVARDTIGTLSHGFRQRVGLAQAIIHQPKFLILDEPTRGLDPVQIVEMRNLIHDLKQNHTVLISSHILTEISQTCDRLLVLGRGRMLAVGTEHDLSKFKDAIRQITVTVRPPQALEDAAPADDPKLGARTLLAAVEGVESVGDPYTTPDGLTFALETSKDCRAAVSRAVVEAKLDLLKLDYARSELENTFVRLVGGDHASN